MELPDPPEGWALKSLIEIDSGSWSAHLWAPEAYVYGYGSSARYAFLDAIKRIEECNFFEKLSGYEKLPNYKAKDLAELIAELRGGIPQQSKRRF